MSSATAVPTGARCAGHPEVLAEWVCPRCGTFFCSECERRTRPDAMPMCPACWDLRAQRVKENPVNSKTSVQTSGLVLGILSILPIWPVILASLVVNIIGIARAKEGRAREVRWRPIVGLSLTCASILFYVVVIALASFSDQ